MGPAAISMSGGYYLRARFSASCSQSPQNAISIKRLRFQVAGFSGLKPYLLQELVSSTQVSSTGDGLAAKDRGAM